MPYAGYSPVVLALEAQSSSVSSAALQVTADFEVLWRSILRRPARCAACSCAYRLSCWYTRMQHDCGLPTGLCKVRVRDVMSGGLGLVRRGVGKENAPEGLDGPSGRVALVRETAIA